MKITLDIDDDKLETFVRLIEPLDYISINEDSDIPYWQQDEVKRRIELIKSEEMKTRSWAEAQKDIFKK